MEQGVIPPDEFPLETCERRSIHERVSTARQMVSDVDPEIRRLRLALRDLVALSTISAAWVGREPSAIAAALADVLVGALHLDVAFVRLCDPMAGGTVDVTRGNACTAFPEWLQRHLAAGGQLSRSEIIRDPGGAPPCRALIIPIGVNGEAGLVAVACDRTDFPTQVEQLLLSVAANHAAAAFQTAQVQQELREARNQLEGKVGERTAELRLALDEITKSRHRLRLVIDTIPGMVWSGLPDGSFDFVNQPWLTYLGCSWEELSARGGLVSAVHPDDVEESVERWRATRAAGRHTDHELRMRRADGHYRWFLTRALPLRDEGGNIVHWYGTATDIEDRKRAEMLLAGEKRLFEMMARGESHSRILDASCRLVEELASGSLSSILLLDPSGNRLRHGAAPSLPRSYAEAIDGSVIGPSVGSCGTAAYRAQPVIVSDIASDPLWADYRHLALGHGLHACWSTPILSSEGKVLGTFAIYYREPRRPTSEEHKVVEQITHLASIAIEREQSGEALREQASLLDLTHDTIFVRDLDNIITYWNRGAEELYGWTRHEAVGAVSHALLKTVFPASLGAITRRLLETGRWSGELIHTKRDGTQALVASRWSLQRNERGEPIGVLETNNDITDRRHAEEALRKAQTELTHVARVTTLGEMAASIAHEVDQPLSGVVINANACLRFLSGTAPNLDEVRDGLRAIARDGRRASDVIGRIRTLARRTSAEKALLDMNEIVSDIVVLAEAEARRAGARVRTELAPNLPRVLGDAVQLQQVVLNLFLNGLEAMHAVADRPRELVISTQSEATDSVRVAVQDSGTGIDPQLVSRMFEAFYTTKGSGLGMGLSISRTIVEQHGGRLWAAPNDGPGATFCFTLSANP